MPGQIWWKSEYLKGLVIFLLLTLASNYEMLFVNSIPFIGTPDLMIWSAPLMSSVYQSIDQGFSSWYPNILCGVPSALFYYGFFFHPIHLLKPFFSFTVVYSIYIFIDLVMAGFFMYLFLDRLLKLNFWPSVFGGCLYHCLSSTLSYYSINSVAVFQPAFTWFPILAMLLLRGWNKNSWGEVIVFSALVFLVTMVTGPIYLSTYCILFVYMLLAFVVAASLARKLKIRTLLLQVALIAVLILLMLGPYFFFIFDQLLDSSRIYLQEPTLGSLSGRIKALITFFLAAVPNFHATSFFPLLSLIALFWFFKSLFNNKPKLNSNVDSYINTLIIFSILIFFHTLLIHDGSPKAIIKPFGPIGTAFLNIYSLGMGFSISILCALGLQHFLNSPISLMMKRLLKYLLLFCGLIYFFFWLMLLANSLDLQWFLLLYHSIIPEKLSSILERQFDLYCSDYYVYIFLTTWSVEIILIFKAWGVMRSQDISRVKKYLPALMLSAMLLHNWWMVKPTLNLERFYSTYDGFKEREIINSLSNYDRLFVEHSYYALPKGQLPRYYTNSLISNIPAYYGVCVPAGVIHIYQKQTYDFLKVAEHGLEFLDHPMMERGRSQLNKAIGTERMKMLDMLGVNWIFSLKPLDSERYLSYQRKGKLYHIYKNESALPKFSLFDTAIYTESPKEIFSRILDPSFDPKRHCIVEERYLPERLQKGSSQSITSEFYHTDSLSCQVKVDTPCILMVTDSYHRFWHAYLDGEEVPIFRVNYMFRGVLVPPGEHTVKMKYVLPLWLRFSYWLSMLLSFGILFSAVIYAFCQKNKTTAPTEYRQVSLS